MVLPVHAHHLLSYLLRSYTETSAAETPLLRQISCRISSPTKHAVLYTSLEKATEKATQDTTT